MAKTTYANLKKLYTRYKIALILQNMREKNGAEIKDVSRLLKVPIGILRNTEDGNIYITYDIIKKYCDLFNIEIKSHRFLSKFNENLKI